MGKFYKNTDSAVVLLFLVISSFGQLPPEAPWSNQCIEQMHMKLLNPDYLQTVHDSMYGVDITKISDETVFGNTGGGIQHQYSKVQAWNADMSLIWLGWSRLIDAGDYTLRKTFNITMHDGRWSNTEPNIRYFGSGDYLKKIDVITEEITTLHEFPGYNSVTIGPWEGNISANDRYVVVTKISGDAGIKAAVYDIKNDTILGEKDFPDKFDWASVTPWGDYIVINEFDEGEFDKHGFSGQGATNLYTLNLEFVRKLSDRRAHADFAIDTEGNRVFVEMCDIRMINMETGEVTDLLPATDYTKGICAGSGENPWICGHVSGRNFGMPGWVLISAGIDACHSCGGCDGYFNLTEIFLLKLDGSGTVRHLGFTRSSYNSYEAEAKAVVSPDGMKAIFTSDWYYGNDAGDIVDYVVEFNPKENHSVSTSVDNGFGRVNLFPEGGTYTEGTLITAIAIPDENNIFSGWSGYVSGTNNPVYFRIGTDTSIAANFRTLFSLHVTIVGSGTVVPSGGSYFEGTTKTLTATPDEGYVFSGWSGDINDMINPVEVVMDVDKNITATFSPVTSVDKQNMNNPGMQVYPNPLSDYLTVKYTLQKPSNVKILLFNMLGMKMKVLLNENQQTGKHSETFSLNNESGDEIPDGSYFIKFQVGTSYIETRTILKLHD
jgi:hypothetical protein